MGKVVRGVRGVGNSARRIRTILEILEGRLLLAARAPYVGDVTQVAAAPGLFIENAGQWSSRDVRFLHEAAGADIALAEKGAKFQLHRVASASGGSATARFSLEFVGAHTVTPRGQQRAGAHFNYFLGDQKQHRSQVAAYESVVYDELYEGIDLSAWGKGDRLKYEFHVAPKANHTAIGVRYQGVKRLTLDDQGRLHASLPAGWGEAIEEKPLVYQVIDGKRVDVPARFRLVDNHTYGFEITGAYDSSRDLVIDPDLTWSTYLGGANEDRGWDVTTDSLGNIWLAGRTASSGWVTGGLIRLTTEALTHSWRRSIPTALWLGPAI
jgi:hypothetical protein